MITEIDIHTRIAELLTQNEFNVIASEVEEGFSRPAVFINVYPARIELVNSSIEDITDTAEIKFLPGTETTQECVQATQKFRHIFMYKPFEVGDRKLTIQSIEFDIENKILYTYFDLQYSQATPELEEYEKAEKLVFDI